MINDLEIQNKFRLKCLLKDYVWHYAFFAPKIKILKRDFKMRWKIVKIIFKISL